MAFENYQDMHAGDVIECLSRGDGSALAVSPSLTASFDAPTIATESLPRAKAGQSSIQSSRR